MAKIGSRATHTASKARTRGDAHAAATPAASPAAPEESRAEIYQRITDRIATAIRAGACEWQMSWHLGADRAEPVLPFNAVTDRPYRGVNTVVLWATAQAEGYFNECTDLALTPEPHPDHAAYVASWLKVLRGDKRAIFAAAAKDQAAD